MCADIRIDTDFPHHRKTKKLIQRLGFAGPTHLVFLWSAMAKSRPKGILTDMDESDIALDAQWTGDPQEFIDALIYCGYLEKNGTGYFELHGWEDHQPWVYHSDKRSEKARESVMVRWSKKRVVKGTNTKRIRHEYERDTPSPSPSPSPSPYPYPIPIPIQIDVWNGFVEMRKKIKKPLTDHAAKLLLSEAIKIGTTNRQDPNDIINQSIARSWSGVFAIKDSTGSNTATKPKPEGYYDNG